MSRDADFSGPIAAVIAGRAGFRCSFPGCDCSTIGPGKGPSDVERKGTAAHIFGASPDGPRGTGGLTADQRSSPLNGIWMCADHGRLIDNDKGKNYPAPVLQAWKSLQESRIAKELSGIGTNFGWLESMVVTESPLFRAGSRINFGKVTLLVGNNGTGKTAICEWIAASAGCPHLLDRWSNHGGYYNGLKYELAYLFPDHHACSIRFDGTTLRCLVDEQPAISIEHACRVIYVRDRIVFDNAKDDLDLLAHLWMVNRSQIPAILGRMTRDRFGFVRQVEIRKSDVVPNTEDATPAVDAAPQVRLYAAVGTNPLFSFRALSGREQSEVIVSGAMALADIESRFRPTLLIIELGGQLLPDELLSEYSGRLADGVFHFQTILVSPSDRPKVDWSGWSIVKLEHRPPNVEINQEMIR